MKDDPRAVRDSLERPDLSCPSVGGTHTGRKPMKGRDTRGHAKRGVILPRSSFILAAVLAASTAAAQQFPSKPIRIVVPFTPGSASDILARLIAPKMTENWGQQVVVDNRPS